MILTLDVGNSQLFAGVFAEGKLLFKFRKNSVAPASSDEYGLFLRSVLRENGLDPQAIKHVVIGSVVPDVIYSLSSAAIKYFNARPVLLQAGLKTGLKIKYRNPLEVGADRIANAMAAVHLYPNQNLVVIDFGTATTFCVISKQQEYLGGLIVPGLRLSMEALEKRTAKLPSVEIKRPECLIGRSTVESIQSGLYYAAVGMVREVVTEVKKQFPGEDLYVIGTGGFSTLFEKAGIFDIIAPDLVLIGLHRLFVMNPLSEDK